jgi:alkanesulfonate monooxygenase SsuD/methylene tetrahydromethanopterin reductase-like flavin-dependent oxidoreductase (luciferase family)
MCRLAGELADGFITHPTNSNRTYLERLCIPNLEKGAATAGRAVEDIRVIAGVPIVTGASRAAMEPERERQRKALAFVLSTPAYRRTLELNGWAGLGERLQQMTRDGAWDELSDVVTDDVLDTLVPQATHADLADMIDRWYGDLVSGVLIPAPTDARDDPALRDAIASISS